MAPRRPPGCPSAPLSVRQPETVHRLDFFRDHPRHVGRPPPSSRMVKYMSRTAVKRLVPLFAPTGRRLHRYDQLHLGLPLQPVCTMAESPHEPAHAPHPDQRHRVVSETGALAVRLRTGLSPHPVVRTGRARASANTSGRGPHACSAGARSQSPRTAYRKRAAPRCPLLAWRGSGSVKLTVPSVPPLLSPPAHRFCSFGHHPQSWLRPRPQSAPAPSLHPSQTAAYAVRHPRGGLERCPPQ
jgi:hypothetical protein